MNFSHSENMEYGSNHYGNTLWKPQFLDDGKSIDPEYKREWRKYLMEKNEEQISSSLAMDQKALRFSFYSNTVVKTVFDICKFMKQPPEIRYLAVDIHDRFMVHHFFNVAQTLAADGNLNSTTWEIVKTRMIDQSLLRILSSIQLASKYCNNFRAVTIDELQEVLRSFGQKNLASKYCICKSEGRIYRAIQFRIPTVTPLTYIEMFFEDFECEEIKNSLHLTLSSFLNECIDVLDVAFLFHKEIFHTLYARSTRKCCDTLKDSEFLSVEGDYMYLAAGVIYAAAAVEDPNDAAPKAMLQFFSSATRYEVEDIRNLGIVIFEIILNR